MPKRGGKDKNTQRLIMKEKLREIERKQEKEERTIKEAGQERQARGRQERPKKVNKLFISFVCGYVVHIEILVGKIEETDFL